MAFTGLVPICGRQRAPDAGSAGAHAPNSLWSSFAAQALESKDLEQNDEHHEHTERNFRPALSPHPVLARAAAVRGSTRRGTEPGGWARRPAPAYSTRS